MYNTVRYVNIRIVSEYVLVSVMATYMDRVGV